MNEWLESIKTKVVENKELVIRVGCAVAGAVVGAVITGAIMNNMQSDMLLEELGMERVDEVVTE